MVQSGYHAEVLIPRYRLDEDAEEHELLQGQMEELRAAHARLQKEHADLIRRHRETLSDLELKEVELEIWRERAAELRVLAFEVGVPADKIDRREFDGISVADIAIVSQPENKGARPHDANSCDDLVRVA